MIEEALAIGFAVFVIGVLVVSMFHKAVVARRNLAAVRTMAHRAGFALEGWLIRSGEIVISGRHFEIDYIEGATRNLDAIFHLRVRTATTFKARFRVRPREARGDPSWTIAHFIRRPVEIGTKDLDFERDCEVGAQAGEELLVAEMFARAEVRAIVHRLMRLGFYVSADSEKLVALRPHLRVASDGEPALLEDVLAALGRLAQLADEGARG